MQGEFERLPLYASGLVIGDDELLHRKNVMSSVT